MNGFVEGFPKKSIEIMIVLAEMGNVPLHSTADEKGIYYLLSRGKGEITYRTKYEVVLEEMEYVGIVDIYQSLAGIMRVRLTRETEPYARLLYNYRYGRAVSGIDEFKLFWRKDDEIH
jgi:hypothetical protein